jgi:hypothetical protein
MIELRGQTEIEIAETERRLGFWRGQLSILGETAAGGCVRRIVAGYEVQLDQLYELRRTLEAD